MSTRGSRTSKTMTESTPSVSERTEAHSRLPGPAVKASRQMNTATRPKPTLSRKSERAPMTMGCLPVTG